ncbi:MAG: fibronectin type III domain-containing protein, partial [bacterium]|nr:fibronectin type III domain-containing protein [bacterium]
WGHDSDATETVIAGLRGGAAYEVRVAAVNGAGAGGWSPVVVGEPTVAAPAAPGVPVVVAGPGRLALSWAEPDANGAPVSGYVVEYRLDGGGGRWVRWGHDSDATETVIAGLRGGAAYEVRVAAVNAEGAGDYSPAAEATTGDAGDQ